MTLLKHIFIFLITFAFFNPIQAQKDSTTPRYPIKVSTRIGLNTFNELNIQFEKPISEKLGFELYLGYNYGSNVLSNLSFWCENVNQLAITKKKGPIFKFGPSLYRPESNTTLRFLFEARLSTARIFIDPLCNNPTSPPLLIDFDWEWKWDGKDFGLMIYYDKLKPQISGPSFYVGLGLALREYNSLRLPVDVDGVTWFSSKEENDVKPILKFDIGWRFGGWKGE